MRDEEIFTRAFADDFALVINAKLLVTKMTIWIHFVNNPYLVSFKGFYGGLLEN